MKSTIDKKKAFKKALPASIPVFVGFLVLGAAYGVLMESKGYGVFWAVLMSAVAFCGSMQYVAITLLVSTFQPVYALLLSVLVNARHLFYGLSLLNKYKEAGKLKPFLIFLLCDETFSIVCDAKTEGETKEAHWFYFFVSILNYSYWSLGTLIGGLLGAWISFDTAGLDFALTALFVVIFVEQWKSVKRHEPALIGLLSSAICLIVFKETFFIIASMISILVISIVFQNKLDPLAEGDERDDSYLKTKEGQ